LISASSLSLPWRNLSIGLGLWLTLVIAIPMGTAKTKGGQGSGRAAQKLPETEGALRSSVQSGRLDDLRWPDFSDYRADVDNFYRPSGYALTWIQGDAPTKRAREMVEMLRRADAEGLNPEDYDGPRWAERFARLETSHSSEDEARFDVALTVCAMRYISDVRIGRINPKHFQFGLDVEHKKLNLPSFLRELVSEQTGLEARLAGIEPPFAQYKATRQALLRYMELAKEDDGEKLPRPPGIVFAGGPYEGISRLASRLRQIGDLSQDAIIPADSKVYEGPLIDAVKRFQKRHGLTSNGYLTVDTVEQLNVPLRSRVEQLRLALERYRWLRYTFAQPPVVVNLPEYRMRAFDRDGGVGLAMNVNVGDAYDFQTPVFESSIRYLVFRPYWNVPPRILRNEVIPDIAEDRSYIVDNDMEVTTPAGQVVASGPISDSVLQQLRAGKLTVRQKPGPENALGLVKIIFPNEHHVYLHDTPESVDMFSEQHRALSHGCIHLQEPAELAAWLLKDKPEWNLERVEHAMHEGRDNLTVNLTKPVPILIVYGTAIVEENGEVHFYRDIYGHDEALETALAKGYPYPK
jgi:murein L,D-transpeptidase YcbB/YkuD